MSVVHRSYVSWTGFGYEEEVGPNRNGSSSRYRIAACRFEIYRINRWECGEVRISGVAGFCVGNIMGSFHAVDGSIGNGTF